MFQCLGISFGRNVASFHHNATQCLRLCLDFLQGLAKTRACRLLTICDLFDIFMCEFDQTLQGILLTTEFCCHISTISHFPLLFGETYSDSALFSGPRGPLCESEPCVKNCLCSAVLIDAKCIWTSAAVIAPGYSWVATNCEPQPQVICDSRIVLASLLKKSINGRQGNLVLIRRGTPLRVW